MIKNEKKYKGLSPHNDAQKNEIAKTVLMPGDPLRAKVIAEKYLDEYKLVNNVRGMLAYTGKYKGIDVTVMGSGMGIASMGIYSSELFDFYDVENIIRIGSTAAMKKEIKLFDILIAEDVIGESTFHEAVMGEKADILHGNKELIDMTMKSAQKLNLVDKIHKGVVWCSDAFYRMPDAAKNFKEKAIEKNTIGIEMESVGLYTNAKRFNKRGLTILSVSDHAITGEVTTSEQRQNSFSDMMELALDVAINL